MSKPVAKAIAAAKTNKTPDSLVKCEVEVESGVWVSPESCATYKIDADANFPSIVFEIKTEIPGPYEWSWEIKWVVLACPQKKSKPRFKPKRGKTYSLRGRFSSSSKQWQANLDGQVIGGELTVCVKAGVKLFTRKTVIEGTEPGRDAVLKELASFAESQPREANLAKRIFTQETNFHHFYSDGQPLVSFDNGYGLGQATTPVPTYEQAWSWKKHVGYIVKSVIVDKRKLAKKYLDRHGKYSEDDLDVETLVYYNGANYHYFVWDEKSKSWIKNESVLCDPLQSNTGWDLANQENQGKAIEQLRKGEGGKPKYTGRCYAEHILKREGRGE
ncbi:MAG: hypothetical protein AB1437_14965 [Pseudomonadota bacterium]